MCVSLRTLAVERSRLEPWIRQHVGLSSVLNNVQRSASSLHSVTAFMEGDTGFRGCLENTNPTTTADAHSKMNVHVENPF